MMVLVRSCIWLYSATICQASCASAKLPELVVRLPAASTNVTDAENRSEPPATVMEGTGSSATPSSSAVDSRSLPASAAGLAVPLPAPSPDPLYDTAMESTVLSVLGFTVSLTRLM